MSTVNVTFRVDTTLKEQADVLFSELGLNLSTAFNIFLRQSVREQQIPFFVTKNTPNSTTLTAMDSAEQNKDVYVPFNSVNECMKESNQ